MCHDDECRTRTMARQTDQNMDHRTSQIAETVIGHQKLESAAPAHTPTPWELIDATEHHGAYIVNSWGRTICDLYAMSNPMAASVRNGGTSFPVHFDDMAANAAFIVKATSNHYALVKALNLALSYLFKFEPADSRAVSDEFVAMAAVVVGDISPEVMRVIDDALLKAQGSAT